MSQYKIKLIFVVVISIIISAVAGAASSLFLKILIDDYITPLLTEAVPDFSELFRVYFTFRRNIYYSCTCIVFFTELWLLYPRVF